MKRKSEVGHFIVQDQMNAGGGFDQNQLWAGQMDNLRIYNRALSKNGII